MSCPEPSIASATLDAFFIFEVADTIDLAAVGRSMSAQPAPLRPRAPLSAGSIRFAVPPLLVGLPPIEVAGRAGTVAAKIFDFGVVSVRFAFPYAGSWEGFAALASELRHADGLPEIARKLLDGLLATCAAALDEPHAPLLEDYFICTVERFDDDVTASALLTEHRGALAALLLAESAELGPEAQSDALRLSFSYYPDDLVVVLWDAAFVYENRDDAEVIHDLLEFANSQLVEFRTYDARLDGELDTIYAMETSGKNAIGPFRRRTADARAEQLRYLMVDVRELADRASNALKIIGDAYYARIYRGIASRLGIEDWQRQIESKLDSVGEVYRYLIDQAQIARSEFLEIIVIVLIAIEIVVGIVGLRR